MKYKVVRTSMEHFDIYRSRFGVVWHKVSGKPSWSLSKSLLFKLGVRRFEYEDRWSGK